MGRICKQCGGNMIKAETMDSGNATYETWRCESCHEREKFCVGIN